MRKREPSPEVAQLAGMAADVFGVAVARLSEVPTDTGRAVRDKQIGDIILSTLRQTEAHIEWLSLSTLPYIPDGADDEYRRRIESVIAPGALYFPDPRAMVVRYERQNHEYVLDEFESTQDRIPHRSIARAAMFLDALATDVETPHWGRRVERDVPRGQIKTSVTFAHATDLPINGYESPFFLRDHADFLAEELRTQRTIQDRRPEPSDEAAKYIRDLMWSLNRTNMLLEKAKRRDLPESQRAALRLFASPEHPDHDPAG